MTWLVLPYMLRNKNALGAFLLDQRPWSSSVAPPEEYLFLHSSRLWTSCTGVLFLVWIVLWVSEWSQGWKECLWYIVQHSERSCWVLIVTVWHPSWSWDTSQIYLTAGLSEFLWFAALAHLRSLVCASLGHILPCVCWPTTFCSVHHCHKHVNLECSQFGVPLRVICGRSKI